MERVPLILIISFSIQAISFSQEVDSIKDLRDGRVYRVVKIGQQWWMQENLNTGNRIHSSQAASNNGIIEKYCYSNSDNMCNKYGGLYRWNEMMNYEPSDNGNPGTVKGICPAGWHIPTDAEWQELEMYLGMTQTEANMVNIWRGTGVGTKLKAGGSSGYEALCSGRCSSSGAYSLLDEYEYVWTATEYADCGWRRCLSKSASNVGRWNTFPKTYAFSVRCVKDICLIENISLNIKHVSCYGFTNGEIDLTVKGGGQFTYQWSTEDTTEDLSGLPAGVYKVTVTDSFGYSIDTTVLLSEPDRIFITADYTPEINSGTDTGYITLDVSGGTSPYTYLWSNGNTSQMLMDLEAGQYRVKVTDSHQCTDSASYTILNKLTCPDEEICIVTTDTLTGKNLVIWEKSDDRCIDHYNIYREDTLIGTNGYEEMSIFQDKDADPAIQPYKYQISVTDTSGNESSLSPYHKPLFLVISRSAQSINLSWSEYEINGEPLEFLSYTVYRSSDTNTLSPLEANLHINFYADSDTLALERKYFYRVAGVLGDPCHPAGLTGEKPDITYTRSFSNRADNVYCPGCDFTPPSVPEGLQASVARNTITLVWNSSEDADGVKSYNIYDWNNNIILAAGDTFHVFTGLAYNTEYFFAVTAVDSLGNESESGDIISATTEELTGVNNMTETPVRIRPNPFVYMTTIQFPNPDCNRYQVYIYDLTGKVMRTMNGITEGEIVLYREDLQSGMYLVEIQGNKIYRGKMLVE
jgi:uncharacterized protein (TIGR02145 family)